MELKVNIEADKKTLVWLAEVCTQAQTEAENGSTSLANRLGQNGSFAYYFNNVHLRKVMSPEQFSGSMKEAMKDLSKLRESYEMLEAMPVQDARISKIEEALAKLIDIVGTKFEESATPAPKKKKPAKEEADDDTSEEA